VQKGPFVQGTEITVAELNADFLPTGRVFSGAISDNTGAFNVRGALAYPYVSITANGYYFNEVAGALSQGTLKLRALADLRSAAAVNLNPLTDLEYERVLYLVDRGAGLGEAKAQAQQEILRMFNITSSATSSAESLDISRSGDGNAILLAVSAILQSERSEAQVTELLSAIGGDLRVDGVLNNPVFTQALLDGMESLKPLRAAIRAHVADRYRSLGVAAVVPNFEDFAYELDTTAPQIQSTSPQDNAETFAGRIRVTFDELVLASSINGGAIVLSDAQGTVIAGAFSMSNTLAADTTTANRVDFRPDDRLPPGQYRLQIAPSIADLAGNGLAAGADITFQQTEPDPSEMVLVPAGAFPMGCDGANPAENCNWWEQPLHSVEVSAFQIDKVEVTNGRYKVCVEAGDCLPPSQTSVVFYDDYYDNPLYDDYPVVFVGWEQAHAFCAWAGKRLPTEAEWEKAGRGATDTRKYPWGNEPPDATKTNWGSTKGIDPVGSYPAGASPYGVLDMAGNVWEWVSDWFRPDYYSVSPAKDPQGPDSGSGHILRGGSWIATDGPNRLATRGGQTGGFDSLGFRCAKSASQ
jgi:formylglycine-generating enzyme required for sulfatase activity